MDVFLVPIGERYELYCEVPDVAVEFDPEEARGRLRRFIAKWRHRLTDTFKKVLAEAERERREARVERTDRGWFGRLRARGMRFVAESIAEQRLLWHLRGKPTACLFHPDDVDGALAIGVMRKQLGRDFDKHQFWMIFDMLGLLGSFLLVPIPGPNFILYYFGFRVVGHFLSLRGARQGLNVTDWRTEPSAPLTELRRASVLEGPARAARLSEIAGRLRLEHLAAFFDRTAIPTA
jgi:hypothetical protein